MNSNKPKIIAVVGPTAAGKSALGVELALGFNGEVISCDSRQVYRGLDLGSGKITREEMRGVQHHLLDVVPPTQVYTVADYVSDAKRAVNRTLERSNLPIVVGGSFLYLDSLLGRISLPPAPPNPTLRAELEVLDNRELIERLRQLDFSAAERMDANNQRRLIRAIEVATLLGHLPPPLPKPNYEPLIIGIKIDRDTLRTNIAKRLEVRLEAGLVDEVRALIDNGITHKRLESLGLEYRYLSYYLKGEITESEMIIKLNHKIYQYAKRQETWLKRYSTISWFDYPVTLESIRETVENFLASPSRN